MAMYEFLCEGCGHRDDLIRKMDDPAITNCPRCQQLLFQKQVSAPRFQLSGSGWYETDFKNTKAPASPEKKETKKND